MQHITITATRGGIAAQRMTLTTCTRCGAQRRHGREALQLLATAAAALLMAAVLWRLPPDPFLGQWVPLTASFAVGLAGVCVLHALVSGAVFWARLNTRGRERCDA